MLETTLNFTSSNTATIGWTVKAGANTVCTSTCTHACVMGFATLIGGDSAVTCSDATADKCLCAGEN